MIKFVRAGEKFLNQPDEAAKLPGQYLVLNAAFEENLFMRDRALAKLALAKPLGIRIEDKWFDRVPPARQKEVRAAYESGGALARPAACPGAHTFA